MSAQFNEPDGSQASYNTSVPLETGATSLKIKQQRKQDALGLAEFIYDIFKGSLSNDTIVDESRKDKQNV